MLLAPGSRGPVRRRLACPFCLAISLAALSAACGGKQTPAAGNPASGVKVSAADFGAKFDRSRCDDQGKQAVTLDANNDGKPDVVKLFLAVAQDGHTTQQLVCKQTDLDFDGKIDLVQYYGTAGDVFMDEYSMDYSGKFNGRTFFQEGKKIRSEKDMDFNGKPDYFEFFEGGKLVRVERDRNDDGKVDEWQYYEGGRLDRIGWDTTGAGRVDKWERNPEGGPETPAAAAAAAAAGAVTPATPAGAADAAAAAAAASEAARGSPKVENDASKK
ncbi:MAG: hypothetical protein JXP73_06280 [Deltaproteobacteria bacterium]|nr:hypothetical protein [Deltaproteobacteria bacterium]